MKGLGSAFAWLLLSVSHKGQQKKTRKKTKEKTPSYTTITQLISTKLSLVSYLSISVLGNRSITLPLKTPQSTLQGELEEKFEAISPPDENLN